MYNKCSTIGTFFNLFIVSDEHFYRNRIRSNNVCRATSYIFSKENMYWTFRP